MDAKREVREGRPVCCWQKEALGLECVGRPEAQAGPSLSGLFTAHPLGVQCHSVGLDSPPMGAQRIIYVPGTEPASLSWAGRGEGPICAVRTLAPWRGK